jgi:hypothetical protein
MDLLSGYNSSDDDERDDHSVGLPPPPVSQLPPPTPSSSSSSVPIRKKGKKILSLSAVLPQHIWNQLTNNNDSDDSDDDNDAHYRNTRKKPAPQSQSQSQLPKGAVPSPKDSQMGDLLAELLSTKHSSNNSKKQPGMIAITSATHAPTSSTILGAAFTTFETTTTVIQKKNAQVEDIHGAPTKEQPQASEPTVPSATASAPKTTTATVTSGNTTTKPPTVKAASAPVAAPPRPLARVLAPTIRAAPIVRAAPTTSYQHALPHYQQQQQQYENNPTSTQQQQQQQPPQISSKKAKRQLQTMLRQGNLSQVSAQAYELQAPDTTNTFSLPDVGGNATTASLDSHGVRVVPTQTWAQGSASVSTTISGKQKSKSQLNSLMASAASLEQARAQNPISGSNSSTTKQSSFRNNAKRKYGW